MGLFNFDISLYYCFSMLPFTFVKEYLNPDKEEKESIFSENKGKSGIYCWVNTINGKFYIGSAVNLTTRLRCYYSSSLLKKSRRPINSALLKYGHQSFSLYILEYCDIKDTIEREQFYFDLLKPTYNILSVAGSPLGRIHTEETKLNISKAMQQLPSGENHPFFGRIISE